MYVVLLLVAVPIDDDDKRRHEKVGAGTDDAEQDKQITEEMKHTGIGMAAARAALAGDTEAASWDWERVASPTVRGCGLLTHLVLYLRVCPSWNPNPGNSQNLTSFSRWALSIEPSASQSLAVFHEFVTSSWSVANKRNCSEKQFSAFSLRRRTTQPAAAACCYLGFSL